MLLFNAQLLLTEAYIQCNGEASSKTLFPSDCSWGFVIGPQQALVVISVFTYNP